MGLHEISGSLNDIIDTQGTGVEDMLAQATDMLDAMRQRLTEVLDETTNAEARGMQENLATAAGILGAVAAGISQLREDRDLILREWGVETSGAGATGTMWPDRVHEGPLPDRGNRMKVNGLDALPDVIGSLAGRILRDRIAETIDARFVTREIRTSPSSSETNGPMPEAEITGGGRLYETARSPILTEIDDRLAAIPNLAGTGAEARAELKALTMLAVSGALGKYGVDPKDIELIEHMDALEFRYRNRYVRISTVMRGVIGVHAWDARLDEAQRDRVWNEHDTLEKDGSTIAHMHYYREQGRVPAAFAGIAADVMAAGEGLDAAYSQLSQRMRHHATSNGYMKFQVHSPNLRWAIPIVMHLLEQPTQAGYDLAGTYSATNGFIEVPRPGIIRRAKSKKHDAWMVSSTGHIVPIRTQTG